MVKVGEVYTLNRGGTATVIAYLHSDRVLIRHNDDFEHIQQVQASHLKRGNVKNPYAFSVYGVGYFGHGKYKIREPNTYRDAYDKWHSMLERCYDEKYQKKKPSYVGCTVREDWHCFQNFAEWFYNNPFHSFKYELDKDILFFGNKEYREDRCELVPRQLNTFAQHGVGKDGLPVGVSKRYNRYIARLYFEGDRLHLGSFADLDSAFSAYADAKGEYGKFLAEKWNGKVSDKVCEAIYNWKEVLCKAY